MQLQYAAFSVMYWFFFLFKNCHNNAIQNMKWKFPTNISLLEAKIDTNITYISQSNSFRKHYVLYFYKRRKSLVSIRMYCNILPKRLLKRLCMIKHAPLLQSVPYHLRELLHFIYIIYWYIHILSPMPWSKRSLNS